MDLQNLMKQAQQMQNKIGKIEQELDASEYKGTASGDAVTVVINGKYEVIEVTINDDLCDKENKEMLQDMIMVAFNNAVQQATQDRETKMGAVTAGVKMPGMF